MEETMFPGNERKYFQSKKDFFQWLGRWEVFTWCVGMSATVLFLLGYGGEGNPAVGNGWSFVGLFLFYGGGTLFTAWCVTQCYPWKEEENRWTRYGNRLIFLWLLLGFLGLALGMRGILPALGTVFGVMVLGVGYAIFSMPMKDFSEEEGEETSSPIPEGVTQQWVREVLPTGEEQISGQIVATLAPWQKKSVLYLAFCPPFTHCPKVECYPLEENGEVEHGMEIFPHGAKIPICRVHVSGLEESLTFHFCALEKGEET